MSSMCTLILVLTAVLMNNYGINDFMVKAIENQGITVTPTGYDDHGQVNRIKISGAEGTAATKKIGDGTPYATIRIYKLQKVENSDRSEYDEVLLPPLSADEKGSFTGDNINDILAWHQFLFIGVVLLDPPVEETPFFHHFE